MKKLVFAFTLLILAISWRAAFCQAQSSLVGAALHEKLEVGYNKTTVLVFSANIKKVDLGSADIEARTVKIGENERILRVKARKEADFSSNLHVFTDDGRIFNFQVRYNPHPKEQTVDLRNVAGEVVIPTTTVPQPMLPAQVRDYCAAIADMAPVRRRPLVTSNGMRMRTYGIHIYNGVLFFQFAMRNSSGIPFDIDFSRFYIKDQKNAKRTTAMEKEVRPLYVFFLTAMPIDRHTEQIVVAAFDKFTIGQQKLFMAEFFEAGGDRHLQVRLKGKHLLQARPLLPIPPAAEKEAFPPDVVPGR